MSTAFDRLIGRPEAKAMKRLLLDLDGVIVDLMTTALSRGLLDHYPCRWDFPGCCSPHSMNTVFTDPGLFYDAPPIPGAIDAVKKLSEAFDVWFVSTPWNADSCAQKVRWLDVFGLDSRRLVLTHDKTLIRAWALVDDKPGLFGPWQHVTYAQPWNNGIETDTWTTGLADRLMEMGAAE
jgi:5'(3')-deoxyribonucleotidase